LDSTRENNIDFKESDSEANTFEAALLRKSLGYLEIILILGEHTLNRFESESNEGGGEDETYGIYNL